MLACAVQGCVRLLGAAWGLLLDCRLLVPVRACFGLLGSLVPYLICLGLLGLVVSVSALGLFSFLGRLRFCSSMFGYDWVCLWVWFGQLWICFGQLATCCSL